MDTAEFAKFELQTYVVSSGANGAFRLFPEEIRNHCDWLQIDQHLWLQYCFGMVNRGVIPQPFWWDEQWTIYVLQTDADMDKHLAAFGDVAPGLAQVQQEHRSAFVDAGQ